MGRRDDRKSPRQKMQDAMSTSRGQTILNYAYNWGAAIVIMEIGRASCRERVSAPV